MTAATRLIYDTAGRPGFATATTGRLLAQHAAPCCICPRPIRAPSPMPCLLPA